MRTIRPNNDCCHPIKAGLRLSFTITKQFHMKTGLFEKEKELSMMAKYWPSVSIIMPFEPRIALQTEATHKLKTLCDKIERQLLENYSESTAIPVIEKLRELVDGLDFSKAKKSLAIFVSPIVQKVFYLDIAPAERVVIDESFEIRDLIQDEKELKEYFVLVLSAGEAKIFLMKEDGIEQIHASVPLDFEAYWNDEPTRVANFSDPNDMKELVMDKLLKSADTELSNVLHSQPLPVFALGPVKVLGHFRKSSSNEKNIIGWIHGNFEEAGEPEFRAVVAPKIEEWKIGRTVQVLKELEEARNAGLLAFGMKDVWKAAVEKRGRLLVVERNYVFHGRHGAEPWIITEEDPALENPYHIKDAVDDTIEYVLASHGNVEFVGDGILRDFDHIALITYY